MVLIFFLFTGKRNDFNKVLVSLFLLCERFRYLLPLLNPQPSSASLACSLLVAAQESENAKLEASSHVTRDGLDVRSPCDRFRSQVLSRLPDL